MRGLKGTAKSTGTGSPVSSPGSIIRVEGSSPPIKVAIVSFGPGAAGLANSIETLLKENTGFICVHFEYRTDCEINLGATAFGNTGDPDVVVLALGESEANRELQVFRLIGSGLGTSGVAKELQLKVKTIETHRQHIKQKLGLTKGAELTGRAAEWMVAASRSRMKHSSLLSLVALTTVGSSL